MKVDFMTDKTEENNRVFELLYQLGEAYLKRGQYDQAIEKFTKLVEFGQENLAIYGNLSKAYLSKDRYDNSAVHVFQKTLEFDPNNKVINNILSQIYLSAGREDQTAYRVYKQALNNKPPHSREMMLYLVKIEYKNGNFSSAKSLAEEYFQTYPDDMGIVPYYCLLGWKEERYSEVTAVLKEKYQDSENATILKWIVLTFLKALKNASLTDDEFEISKDDMDYCKYYIDEVAQFNHLNDIYLFLTIKKIVKDASGEKKIDTNQSIAEYELFLSDSSLSNIWDRGLNKLSAMPRLFNFTQEIWNRIIPLNNVQITLPTASYNKTKSPTDDNFDYGNSLMLIQITNYDDLIKYDRHHEILARFDALLENILDKKSIPLLKRLNNGYLLFGTNVEHTIDTATTLFKRYTEMYRRTDGQKFKFQILIHSREPNSIDNLLEDLYILFELQQLSCDIFGSRTAESEHREQNDKIFITQQVHEFIKENSNYNSILLKNIDFPALQDSMPIFEIAWEDPLEKLRNGVIEKIDRFHIVNELRMNDALNSFKAIDSFLDRLVILKILRPDFPVEDRTQLSRIFLENAAVIGKLNHKNIAIIYDINEDEGFCYIGREFVEGTQLTDLISSSGALDWRNAAEICRQTAQGLIHAHNAGLVHARLNPNNIYISEMNEIKITDFTVPEFSIPITKQKSINMQAVSYASPEQIGNKTIDHRTDIYSLGVIFYELLSGNSPFFTKDKKLLFENINKLTPPPLAATIPHLPPKADAILSKALAKSPADRFADMDEFLQELLNMI
ncbi:protein kinase [candidate division KSB1 bacterium]|nr:protein kinase [candidate division KSB1 bacterium]